MAQKNRLELLLAPQNTTLNGIDFVEIATADQRTLRVHFLTTIALQGTVTAARITGGDMIPSVPAHPIAAGDWSVDAANRPVLTLRVDDPGDFSFYTLTLVSAVLDPFFDHARFSFKAGCPSELDCAPPPVVCPPLPSDAPPIDYLAKDFASFRRALSDFSALRYPEWTERSEADFGMVFMEALCSVADDLSYIQDRIAAEATLETATERRSIVRHARLVDYEPRPTTAARVLLQFDVKTAAAMPSGLLVSAQGPDGVAVEFETGTGLIDPATGALNVTTYAVDPRCNRGQIAPYWWDDSERCLRAGASEMWVLGHGLGLTPGQPLLIDTAAAPPSPPRRALVHVVAIEETADPLVLTAPPNPGPTPVTRIVWQPPDALAADHDLTRTGVIGNVVPATHGRRYTEAFAVETPPSGAPAMALATRRDGANSTPAAPRPEYRHTLANAPLCWLVHEDAGVAPLPDILLEEQPVQAGASPVPWRWRRTLLAADPFEKAVTVEPVRLARIARTRDGDAIDDYDGDAGDTLRFGDGVFGEIPDPGDVFRVTYRVGGGTAGNVAADSISRLGPAAAALADRVTNPFAAAGGDDAEPDERVRRAAPQAFRVRQLRAVRAEDYEAAAEGQPWVQRAGTVFRWTGSWMTVFTTADPKGSSQIPLARHTELITLLNRYRLAGYESYVPAPRYVALDLIVTACARPDVFRGDLQAALLQALGVGGFFGFDRFTFGIPLERSAVEAAAQAVPGVAGIDSILYRRRGATPGFVPLEDVVAVGPDEIVRVDNDPSRPEHGSLRVVVKGGK